MLLPGLLQPVGIIGLLLLFGVAYFAAYRRHNARTGRADIHLDVAAIALLALLTGGFFWRVLTESGIQMPAGGGDLASFYFPNYAFAAAQIQAHTIPLWNPHLFGGMPFAADVQMGLFYPLNWILFLFYKVDYPQLEWLLIAHYWLAATFSYLFFRDLGIRRIASIAGAVAFAFCGFMTAHLGHMPMILVATWLPLELLTVRRAVLTAGRAGWAWSIAAGLCMTLALLAGHVQIFSYGLMAAGLLWLYLLLGSGPKSWRDVLPWVLKGGAMLAVALGVSAIQLLPSLELSTQSVRSSISYEEAGAFPAQPVTLLNLFLPRVYGTNPTTYSFGIWQTTENWGYCGVVTLALAAAGIAIKRVRMVGFFVLLVVLALVLMSGDLSIVGGWIYKFVPGFSKLRDAGRALILLGMGLAGLAAFGLDALIAAWADNGALRRRSMWWLVGVGAALVIVAVGIMPIFYVNLLTHQFDQQRLPAAINDLGMLVIWVGIAAGAAWAGYTQRISPRVAGGIITLAMLLDIFSPNSLFNPTTTNILQGYQHFDATSLLGKSTRADSAGLPQRLDSDTNVQDIWQPDLALLTTAGGIYNLYDTGGAFNPLKLERYDYLWSEAKTRPNTPLYDLMGAAFRVVSATNTLSGTVYANQPKWERVQQNPGFDIYQNHNVLPRAFLVHEGRIEPERLDTSIVLWRQDIDPRHTVVLEQGDAVQSKVRGTAETPTGQSPTGESVQATRYTSNAVDIEVKASEPGWLVLTDAWYPGWEATIDGNTATVEPADYAFRAVRVPAGRHTVSMQFRPGTWVWGRLISLVALILTALALTAISLWPPIVRRRRVAQAANIEA